MKAEIPRHQFLFWKIRGVHCTVCGKVLIAQESWRAKDVWPLAFSERSLWSLGGAFVWLRAWYCRSCVGQGELLNYYWIYNLELLREAWPELGKRSTVTQLSENFTQGTKCQLPRGTVLGARQFRAEFWFWHVCQHPHISEYISFPCYPKTSAHWSAWLIKVFFQKGCASSPQILTGCEVCFGKAWSSWIPCAGHSRQKSGVWGGETRSPPLLTHVRRAWHVLFAWSGASYEKNSFL